MIPPSRVQRGEFMDIFEASAMIMMSGGEKAIQRLEVTNNGLYEVPEGVDGFNPVNVLVHKSPVNWSLSVTENGTYTPPSGVDGYNPVIVNVDDRYDEGYADGESSAKANIQSKSITANGIYYAADDGLDGFDPVNVNVPDRYDEGYDDGFSDAMDYVSGDEDTYLSKSRYICVTLVEFGTSRQFYVQLAVYDSATKTRLGSKKMSWGNGAQYSYNKRITNIKWSNEIQGIIVYCTSTNQSKTAKYTNVEHRFPGLNGSAYGVTSNNYTIGVIDYG